MNADLAAVKHAQPQDIAILHGACADNLGEECQTDTHELSRLAALERLDPLSLLLAEARVVDGVERFVPSCVVITGIVLPAESRLIRELLLLDEVDPAQLGGVHIELDGEKLDHSFDEIDRLGHAEGATIAHPARRLVGVDTVHREIGRGDVVGARADVHEARGELRGVSTGIKASVIGRSVAPEAEDLSLLGRRDLALHPVVAGEGGGHEIVHPVLDPLHGLTRDNGGHDGADIAGIGPNLVAEPAPDIRGDDADVVLLNAGDQRDDGADRVRGLEGAVQRELAVHLVHGCHTTACFKRARMRPVVVHHLFGDDRSLVDDLLGGRLVAHFPGEDVVVVLAWTVGTIGDGAVLGGQILAEHNVRFQRLKRVHEHFEFFVFHDDSFNAVGGCIAIFGDDEGHFLTLEKHLAIGQHHLLVTGQCRHPVEAQRL